VTVVVPLWPGSQPQPVSVPSQLSVHCPTGSLQQGGLMMHEYQTV
jgi:hypothetical protein